MKTASKPFSPYSVLSAMEAMQEGYDGSGPYQNSDPILSGIANTEEALHRLNRIMQDKGFLKKYNHEFETDLSEREATDRHKYIVLVYRKPNGTPTVKSRLN
jgi:hypothetical protein